MNEIQVSFGNLWKRSWASLSGNYWKSIAVILICVIISSIVCNIPLGSIFIGPLNVGIALFFLTLAKGDSAQIENIFSPFCRYGRNLWVSLRPGIFIFLWSLLLIIPGFIAAYRYALTFFIAIEEPELSAKEAMTKSCLLMRGHKLQLFGYSLLVFLLLTIGGILTLFIAYFWLLPWAGSFFANFYLAVKAEANTASEAEMV